MSDLALRLQRGLADRYRIGRELGHGGMATVFLAEDLRHHRQVALKMLDPGVASVVGPERFLREIATAARLTHPHILPLHDSGAADGLLYYVMPYVAGESLRNRLNRERQLPLEDSLRITRELADALDYAHRHGVVHRDIKPENILMEEQHALLADFGIARAVAAAGGEALTATGIIVGTPAYMSPEQASGSGWLDGRSDEYSLGCVLYEMLAGEPPFAGPTAESIVRQHLATEPRPVTAVRSSVPAAVEHALARALAKNPADRFATTAEFAAAIGPGIAAPDRPGEAAGEDRPGTMPTAHRRRRLVLAGIAILVALGGFAVWRDPGTRPRWLGGASATPTGKKDWILVADFDGPPDEPSLARAARELASAALDQSAIMATVPRDQIEVALAQAGKPNTIRLTAQLAREIAYRSRVRAVLDGEIVRLGERYAVALRVSDVEEDKQLATLTEVARSDDDLIPVLTRMGKRIREQLGEKPGMIRSTRGDEWPVATNSFEAYRRFVEGGRIYDEGDFAGALRLFREAVTTDPNFGAGWGSVAWAYLGLGQLDSALTALQEARRHPGSITPAYRLYLDGVDAWWRGDARRAAEIFERVARVYPRAYETRFALSNWGLLLQSEGRVSDAYRVTLHGEEEEAFGPSQIDRQLRTRYLVLMGRLTEAHSVATGLRGQFRQITELNLALAESSWNQADSLAALLELAPGAPLGVGAAAVRAQVAAVRGEVSAAEAHLLRTEQIQRESSLMSLAARAPRARVLLAQLSGRTVPGPEPWLASDTTTSALITRGYMAAAAGETALARRLLARLRARSTTRLGAHGSTPEFIEASILAHAARWDEVVKLIAQPAREGSDQGSQRIDPVSDRIGTVAERWLVAQAYERLDQPDSAAAFYLRMLAPGQIASGLVHSYALQRLVMLDARMGRLGEAERHLANLERDFSRPDPDVRHLLDEARAAVMNARSIATLERPEPPGRSGAR